MPEQLPQQTAAANRTVPENALEFLADADGIEQRPMPFLARCILYLITAAIVLFAMWAALSRIDAYVTAQGRVITEGSHVVLQPLDTSIVRGVMVRKGQAVSNGELLVELDPTFSSSDLTRLKKEHEMFAARLERLEAEADGRTYDPANPSDQQSLEQNLFQRNKQENATKRSRLEARLKVLEMTVNRLNSEQRQLSQQLGVLEQLESMKQKLATSGAGSKAHYLAEKLKTLETRRQLESASDRAAESKQEMQEITASIEALDAEWRRRVLQELIEARSKTATLGEQLKKAERRDSTNAIVAPFDGYILNVADRNAGSVVTSGEEIITLVPSNEDLIAEIWIGAESIGKVSLGDEVRVKVHSFPFQKHGVVMGEIVSISGDSFVGPDKAGGTVAMAPGKVYYLARVRIPPIEEALRDLPSGFVALPGMTLSAEIKVGRRRIISYFLYPVFRMLDESIRES